MILDILLVWAVGSHAKFKLIEGKKRKCGVPYTQIL